MLSKLLQQLNMRKIFGCPHLSIPEGESLLQKHVNKKSYGNVLHERSYSNDTCQIMQRKGLIHAYQMIFPNMPVTSIYVLWTYNENILFAHSFMRLTWSTSKRVSQYINKKFTKKAFSVKMSAFLSVTWFMNIHWICSELPCKYNKLIIYLDRNNFQLIRSPD